MDKIDRAMWRLLHGQPLYLLPSGQWKFGGNKFIPNSVIARLPIEPTHTTNRGWIAYKLREE